MGPFRKEFIAVVAFILVIAGTGIGLLSVQKEIVNLQNQPTPTPVKQVTIVTPTVPVTATPEASLKVTNVKIGTPVSATNIPTKGVVR